MKNQATDILNDDPAATYNLVFTGSHRNRDGSRDFILRFSAKELKAFIDLIEKGVRAGTMSD